MRTDYPRAIAIVLTVWWAGAGAAPAVAEYDKEGADLLDSVVITATRVPTHLVLLVINHQAAVNGAHPRNRGQFAVKLNKVCQPIRRKMWSIGGVNPQYSSCFFERIDSRFRPLASSRSQRSLCVSMRIDDARL
jgi:hypothetical protein